MSNITYKRATTLSEVTSLLEENGRKVKILNGGTDLIPQLRDEKVIADMVIDIKEIQDLNRLDYNQDGLYIGSTVTCLDARNDENVKFKYPGLVDAFSLIGGIQIQGRATIGGNICNSSPAADSIPALIAHKAKCQIFGKDGKREVALENFFTGPGSNILDVTELLVGLDIPNVNRGFGGSYIRFTPRNEMDIAVVGVGSTLQINPETGVIEEVRIALGAVAPTPLFVKSAGEELQGVIYNDPSIEDIIEQAALIAQSNCNPISDMRGSASQRKHLVKVLVKRTLTKALERAKSNMDG